MTEYSPPEVEALLALAGLSSPVFDAAAIAADLAERSDLYDTLETLIASEPSENPIAFDPRWHS